MYGGESHEGLKPESDSLTEAYKLAPDFRCDRKSRPAHLLFKHGDVMAVTLTNEVTVCDCERVCWAVKHTGGQRATVSVSQSQPKQKKCRRARVAVLTRPKRTSENGDARSEAYKA